MATFDYTNYQSLSNPLFQKHPYQPNDAHLTPHNDSNLSYYETVKKNVQNMLIRQLSTASEGPNELTKAIKEIQQLNQSRESGLQSFSKDKVQAQVIQHNNNLQQKQKEQYISQNQSLLIKTPLNHQGFDWNQIIVKQSFPYKEENYFQLSGGFNKSYLSSSDDKQTLVLQSKKHPYVFISNLFLLLSLCLSLSLRQEMLWILLGGLFLVYLFIAFGSSISTSLFNLKTKEDLQAALQSLKKSKGYFSFTIQCFHYSTKTTNKNVTPNEVQEKIITFKLTQQVSLLQSFDQSVNILSKEMGNSFLQMRTAKHFCFSDKVSEGKFIDTFNGFVSRNIRDTHQQYSFKFQIDQVNELNGMYCLQEYASLMKWLYTLLTLLALSFPICILMQCLTTRIQAKIIKKIAL